MESKRLVEEGLDKNTADMWISPKGIYIGRKETPIKYETFPCWSLGTLIGLLPKSIQQTKGHDIDLLIGLPKGQWSVTYFDWTGLQHGPSFESDNLIEAVIEMIIWLIENNYIK